MGQIEGEGNHRSAQVKGLSHRAVLRYRMLTFWLPQSTTSSGAGELALLGAIAVAMIALRLGWDRI
jgi:hypothetical protein